MQLHRSTWPEVERYLTSSTSILIPLGSTEQHGPDGLIGTDAICAQAIALRAADMGHDLLIAPTLALTPAQFNLGFPGTVSLRAATFISLITDVVESLARSGFRNFYFLNGHGANIAPVRSAMHDVHQERSLRGVDTGAGLRFKLQSWWDFSETNAMRQSLFGEREGMHATPSEISITQHALDGHNFTSSVTPYDALSARFFARHAHDSHDDAHSHRNRFMQGHVGSDPSMATPEAGEALLNLAATELIADWRAFVQE